MTENATLTQQAERLRKEFESDLEGVRKEPSTDAAEKLRLLYLGRKGKVTQLLEGLRNCSKEERPTAGKAINVLKKSVAFGKRSFSGFILECIP